MQQRARQRKELRSQERATFQALRYQIVAQEFRNGAREMDTWHVPQIHDHDRRHDPHDQHDLHDQRSPDS